MIENRGIKIRRASGKDDGHDLYAMQETCLPIDTPSDVCRGDWWIAYDDDDAIAFAGLYPSHQWTDAVYLVRAGVMPSHRGIGLQKRLIRVRLTYARRQGYNWAVTETSTNPKSSNSLIACGFRIFTPSKPWGLKNAIYFRRPLN